MIHLPFAKMQINLDNVTQFINQANLEDQKVLNDLFDLLYDKVKQLASIQLNKLNPNESISATQLVHECYLKLNNSKSLSIKNRNHFYSLSARCMRFYLVDLVRQAHNQKNEGIHTELKVTQLIQQDDLDFKLLELDRLLEQLEQIDEELASITELKFFGGFTFDEIADIKGQPKSTVFKRWTMAKSYLINLIEEGQNQTDDNP
ncbi:ECF-type sigma factor [Marinicella sediminis]|nr:ECF-type sigma factor [Marinicella sediminis]